jgi:cyclophilin family peptidyl-prolyl cis-trans isomerase
VGTAKRERQKANRAQREQELVKAASRARVTRIAVIVVGSIVAVFGLVFLAGQFLGDDDSSSDSDAATELDTETGGATQESTDDATGDSVVDDVDTAPVVTDPAEPVAVPTVEVNDAEVVPDGCPPITGTDEQTQTFDEAPPFCLDPEIDYTAVITTNLGVVEVDLDQQAAPNTVNSFVFLARNNYFNDTVCHRIIQDFVVQCGDPTASGTGGPGYSTLDELPPAGQYQVGSLAMANSGPDTQGSQFFIITGDAGVALPPAYSLFGQISEEGLGTVTEMDARGSLDSSGTPSAPVELIDVQIATA